jgi:hypothetical protein
MDLTVTIKDYIKKGRTEAALSLLESSLKNSDKWHYNQVITLSARFQDQMYKQRTGIGADSIILNSINLSILELIDEIEKELPVETTPNTKQSANNFQNLPEYKGQLTKAWAAYDDDNYDLAIKIMEPFANNLNAEGECLLGVIYAEENYENKDYVKGIPLLIKAAEKGELRAQTALGLLYYSGTGVAQDFKKALYFLELAYDNPAATGAVPLLLGTMYLNGFEVKKNVKTGIRLYKETAEKGDSDSGYAAERLATFYFEGEYDIEVDTVESEKWALKANSMGRAEGANILGFIRYTKMNYKEAAKYFQIGADAGIPNSQYMLGLLYHDGLGVKQDIGNAIDLYKEAMEQGHAEAANNLGNIFLNAEEYSQAFLYFQRAFEKESAAGAFNLGYLYKNGLGVKKNKDFAKQYFEIALQRGFESAKEQLDELNSFWSFLK